MCPGKLAVGVLSPSLLVACRGAASTSAAGEGIEGWIQCGVVADSSTAPDAVTGSLPAGPGARGSATAGGGVLVELPLCSARVRSSRIPSHVGSGPGLVCDLAVEEAEAFVAFTAANIERGVAVIVDGIVVCQPRIVAALRGPLRISGLGGRSEYVALRETLAATRAPGL